MTDRRKGKIFKVVASHSILNGRLTATEEDLIVLKYIAPKELDDFEKVSAILSEELKTPEKYMKELTEIYNNIKEAMKFVNSLSDSDPRLVEMIRSLKATRDRIISLGKESGDERVGKFAKEVIVEIDNLIEKVAKKLGIYP
jgi:hypothetical protein